MLLEIGSNSIPHHVSKFQIFHCIVRIMTCIFIPFSFSENANYSFASTMLNKSYHIHNITIFILSAMLSTSRFCVFCILFRVRTNTHNFKAYFGNRNHQMFIAFSSPFISKPEINKVCITCIGIVVNFHASCIFINLLYVRLCSRSRYT